MGDDSSGKRPAEEGTLSTNWLGTMRYSQWQYTVLLASMVLLTVVRFTVGQTQAGHLATNACVVLLIGACVAAACSRPRSRLVALLLGLPILVVTGWSLFEWPHPSHPTFVLQRSSMTIFLAFTTISILLDLIDRREITRDTFVGAFCGYLLLGVIWTELYCWIDLASPNSFSEPSPAEAGTAIEPRWGQMQYFSFMTLSTLGYGDILPIAPLPRLLACMEAICGQFYLAILVAGLVSVRVGQLTTPSTATEAERDP